MRDRYSPPDDLEDLSPTTTKGDLIVHDGTDNERLAVGGDRKVLTADSSEDLGVKWEYNPPVVASLPNTNNSHVGMVVYHSGEDELYVRMA